MMRMVSGMVVFEPLQKEMVILNFLVGCPESFLWPASVK